MPSLETVFLDRDGTINIKAPEGAYISAPDQLVLLPGAAAAIRHLNSRGVRVLVVTNQRGIARGLMTLADLERIHRRLVSVLWQQRARLDSIYVCPHERDQCFCRKPLPGLVYEAIRRQPDIQLATAAVIGDADSDVALGRRLGVKTVRIVDDQFCAAGADHTSPDLLSAVTWLLEQSSAHEDA